MSVGIICISSRTQKKYNSAFYNCILSHRQLPFLNMHSCGLVKTSLLKNLHNFQNIVIVSWNLVLKVFQARMLLFKTQICGLFIKIALIWKCAMLISSSASPYNICHWLWCLCSDSKWDTIIFLEYLTGVRGIMNLLYVPGHIVLAQLKVMFNFLYLFVTLP